MEMQMEYSFTWAIENVSYCWQKNNECISSPAFIVHPMSKTKWALELHPKGEGDFISLFLRRQRDCKGPESYEIDFKISFLALDGSVLVALDVYGKSFEKNMRRGANKFMKCDEVFKVRRKEFLPRDVLTTRCRIWKCFSNATDGGHCLARTRIGVQRRSFIWKIERFSCFQKSECQVPSVSEGESMIMSTLYTSAGQNNKTLIRAFLNADDEVKFSTFHLHLVDSSGNRKKCLSDEITFDGAHKTQTVTLIFSKEKLMENKNLYLPNNILTLHCEGVFATGIISDGIENLSYGCLPSEGNLTSDDLESRVTSLDSTKILKERLF